MDARNPLAEQLPALRRLAHALVGEDDADDLVQDVAVAALEGDTPGTAPYLRTVLRRRFIDRLRQRGRRGPHAALTESCASTEGGPRQQLARLERHAALIEGLRALEPGDRDVLIARYFDGRSAALIAEADGVTASAVRSRIQRALTRLRSDLARRHGPSAWLAVVAPIANTSSTALTAKSTAAARVSVQGGPWVLGPTLAAATLAAGSLWLAPSTERESTLEEVATAIDRSSAVSQPDALVPLHPTARGPARVAVSPAAAPARPVSRAEQQSAARPWPIPMAYPGAALQGRIVLGDGTPVPSGVEVAALDGDLQIPVARAVIGEDGAFRFDEPVRLPACLVLKQGNRDFTPIPLTVEFGVSTAELVADLLVVQLTSPAPTSAVDGIRWLSFSTEEPAASNELRALPAGGEILLREGPGYRFTESAAGTERFAVLDPGAASGRHALQLVEDHPRLAVVDIALMDPSTWRPAGVLLAFEPTGRSGAAESLLLWVTPGRAATGDLGTAHLLPGTYRVSADLIAKPGPRGPLRASVPSAPLVVDARDRTTLPVRLESAAGALVHVRVGGALASGYGERPCTLEVSATPTGPWTQQRVAWGPGNDTWQSGNSFPPHMDVYTPALDAGACHVRLLLNGAPAGQRSVVLENGEFTRIGFSLAQ